MDLPGGIRIGGCGKKPLTSQRSGVRSCVTARKTVMRTRGRIPTIPPDRTWDRGMAWQRNAAQTTVQGRASERKPEERRLGTVEEKEKKRRKKCSVKRESASEFLGSRHLLVADTRAVRAEWKGAQKYRVSTRVTARAAVAQAWLRFERRRLRP